MTDKNNINEEIENELIKNKEILLTLLFENLNRKEKDYMTYKELELIENFEENLVKIMESCPENFVKKLSADLNN